MNNSISEIVKLKYNDNIIRVVVYEGDKPWAVAEDICKIFVQDLKLLTKIPDDIKRKVSIEKEVVTLIDERAIQLFFADDNKFKQWVIYEFKILRKIEISEEQDTNYLMSKKKVYIETSIVSYYTARPSRDLIVAARQEITHELWQFLLKQYEVFISALVIQEASRGDENAAAKRLSLLSNISVLEITQDVQDLARDLINDKAIPSEYNEDALHIATATINGMDFLLTWNFSHINNVFTKSKIVNSIEKHGYEAPVICSPEELLLGE